MVARPSRDANGGVIHHGWLDDGPAKGRPVLTLDALRLVQQLTEAAGENLSLYARA